LNRQPHSNNSLLNTRVTVHLLFRHNYPFKRSERVM